MLKTIKEIIKRLLAIVWIRKLYEGVTKFLLEIFGSNRLLGTIYSFLGFITFNREQYSVLRARRNYYRNFNKDGQSHVGLRRNIHRLEKGMSMQPRRDVFAQDYIGETVEFYNQAIQRYDKYPDNIDISELEWAYDVLSEYFNITGSTPIIDRAREDFGQIKFTYDNGGKQKAPYKRGDLGSASVSYDDLLALSMRRRSVRWFKQEPVPRELIDKAMMVARQSPTACNRLPYEFKIYDDPELLRKVSAIPFGTGGYAHNIPMIIVIAGKLDSYFSPRDRHAIYIDASLAAMPFMYALETLGLASSAINWPDFEPLEIKMQKTIGLGVDERVVMMMAVGYPDPESKVPFSQKKSLDVIRSYNDIGK